jgi:predicted dehydrogenase
MKALLIGRSRIARRRVLPALRSCSQVQAIAIASKSAKREDVEPDIELFNDYEKSIRSSGADIAYVSVANSDHAYWALRCLRAGMHVVVDKPAALSIDQARAIVAQAHSAGRCVAEATVFGFHPQLAALHRTFRDAEVEPTRVSAVFSFPPFDPSDFRNYRELGGGAFNDLGPYLTATSRLVFGRAPRSLSCVVSSRNADDLETGFSALLAYDRGGVLVGHFGFDTEYQNRLLTFGPSLAVEINRAFTLPADSEGRLCVRRNNIESEIKIPPADAFEEFLRAVLEAIARKEWSTFSSALLADAQLLADLREAAGE